LGGGSIRMALAGCLLRFHWQRNKGDVLLLTLVGRIGVGRARFPALSMVSGRPGWLQHTRLGVSLAYATTIRPASTPDEERHSSAVPQHLKYVIKWREKWWVPYFVASTHHRSVLARH
jgi:hypothetical protein